MSTVIARPARPVLAAAFAVAAFLLALLAPTLPAAAQPVEEWKAWNQPVEPFRIADGLYYVGANEIAAYLFTTPEGHILLDGGFAETVPLIVESIGKLGFKVADVKILLNSHAHVDHAGGLARLEELTGARFYASAGDRPVLASGGKADPGPAREYPFPPIVPDAIVADGEKVSLGGVTLVARLTPGHTPGCTTWTTEVTDGDRRLAAVFVCSPNVLDGTRLVGDADYPGIADDFASTFATLRALPCDIPLGPHASYFQLEKKHAALTDPSRDKTAANPFVDPEGYRAFVDRKEAAFRAELERQRGESSPGE